MMDASRAGAPPVVLGGQPVLVRPATVADAQAVVRLLAESGRPAPTAETQGAFRGAYERQLARQGSAFLVAHAGERVVGFLALEFRDRLNVTREEAWIPELVVAPDARQRGIGCALITRAMEIVVKRRALRLVVEVEHAHTHAREFCEHLGMEELGHFFAWTPERA